MQALKITIQFTIAGISISLATVHLALSCALVGLLCVRAGVGLYKDIKKPNNKNTDEKN